MVVMDTNNSKEKGIVIDLESGMASIMDEDDGSSSDPSGIGPAKKLLNRNHGFKGLSRNREAVDFVNGFSKFVDRNVENAEASVELRFAGHEKVGLLEKKVGSEKSREKARRKPPKPPRPPQSPVLDAADRKLVQEISELAMLKQSRIERIKALKSMRKAKAGNSSSNLCALVITILFCIIIIWQGLFSKNSPSVSSHRSPESSVVRSAE